MENKSYFENLDGLRGYAALAVFFYHLNITFWNYWQIMSYGWMWVECFFVVSGFLITRILLTSKDQENYFRHFYFRRSVRILPLYFLCLFFVFFYWIFHNLSVNDTYAYFLFIQNWIIWIHNWVASFPSIFWHSWTIAIEQQFYLVWPLIIRYTPIRLLKYICIFWILFSIISRFYLFENFSWFMASYATISHMDTLLWWSFLAILHREWKKIQTTLRYSFLIMVFTLMIYLSITYLWALPVFWEEKITSINAAWPTLMIFVFGLSTFIVHYLLIAKNRITSYIFSNSWISYLGKISYGIYLYHVIIIHIFETELSFMMVFRKYLHIFLLNILQPFYESLPMAVIETFNLTLNIIRFLLIILTLFIAHISYKYFEKRFLSLK